MRVAPVVTGIVVATMTTLQIFGSAPPEMRMADDGDSSSSSPKVQRLCHPSELTKGEWIPVQHDKLPYLSKQIERKQCYSSMVSPWNTYEWQPSADCFLGDFSAKDFCRLAFNQTIALLGDSLTMEHFSALVHTLGVVTFDEESTFQQGGPKSFDFEVCGGRTRLYFRRSNWLREFETTLHEVEPDILIMNRGSWYSTDEKLVGRIEQSIGLLESWKRPLHLIWRTTVPGHPECNRFHEPATNLQLMEHHVTNMSLYTEQMLRWHWYDFQHQNRLVVESFSESSLDWDLLDAYSLNVLRPDEHLDGDCLHNCQPGSKTLVLNRILLHLMKLRAGET
jgi:hypothetical protein